LELQLSSDLGIFKSISETERAFQVDPGKRTTHVRGFEAVSSRFHSLGRGQPQSQELVDDVLEGTALSMRQILELEREIVVESQRGPHVNRLASGWQASKHLGNPEGSGTTLLRHLAPLPYTTTIPSSNGL
jgi:hypothetical protein